MLVCLCIELFATSSANKDAVSDMAKHSNMVKRHFDSLVIYAMLCNATLCLWHCTTWWFKLLKKIIAF